MNVYKVEYKIKWNNEIWETDEKTVSAKDVYKAIDKVKNSVMKETWKDDDGVIHKRASFKVESVIKEMILDL